MDENGIRLKEEKVAISLPLFEDNLQTLLNKFSESLYFCIAVLYILFPTRDEENVDRRNQLGLNQMLMVDREKILKEPGLEDLETFGLLNIY
ncbi:unnamed protein product [Rhizophagus irregularis]|nr:unnamed protein product [Rhizophagus irregularis]